MEFVNAGCPLCGKLAKKSFVTIDAGIFPFYDCPQCGKYSIQRDDFFWLGQAIGVVKHGDRYYFNNPDDKEYKRQLIILSSYISLSNESDSKPLLIFVDDNYIKMALNSPAIPNTPEEKVEAILNYTNNHSKFFGDNVVVEPKIIFSDNEQELNSLISELCNNGYIKKYSQTENNDSSIGMLSLILTYVSITLRGIEYIKGKKNGMEKTKCFVAMWFNPSMDKIYDDVIKPICEEVGYKTIRVDKLQFNDDITDQIIAEIKESYFVIADLTGFRGGVYYEAGFARGLGKEVILTCKKDYEIKIRYEKKGKLIPERGPHFDVSHLSTIFWNENELDELKQNLKDRILATVGRGSYESENIVPIRQEREK